MRFLPSLLPAIALIVCVHAEDAPKVSQWNGYERLDFKVADRAALLVKPKTPAPGLPWIWRTEFFGHEPQADTTLLEQRCKALGGKIEVIAKPGVDHHPHSLKDPKPIVDFVLTKALK